MRPYSFPWNLWVVLGISLSHGCAKEKPVGKLKKNKCFSGPMVKRDHGFFPRILGGTELLDMNDPRVTSTVLLGNGCTGVLATQNMVITAAHCIDSTMTIVFDPDRRDSKQFGQKKGKNIKKHPKFQGSKYDIAFITFDGPPPAPFKPLPIFKNMESLKPGQSTWIAGYGTTKKNGPAPNHLRTVEMPLYKYLSANSKPSGPGLILIGPNKGKGSCNGDSGGPIFIKYTNGKWYTMGVDHGVDPSYFPGLQIGSDDCAPGANVYTSIAFFQEWIETNSGEKLMMFDGTNDPSPPSGPGSTGTDNGDSKTEGSNSGGANGSTGSTPDKESKTPPDGDTEEEC